MREISVSRITEVVAELCRGANRHLPEDVRRALERGRDEETSPLAREILDRLLLNARLAAEEDLPICQDCGLAVVFVELGREVSLDGDLQRAVDEGVRRGYQEGYLRKSVCDPFTRANTKDNTPSVVHLRLVEGDRIKITLAAKGGGSENMSRVVMLRPAAGWEGIRQSIIDAALAAGPNPCPPIILGVGIGGNFERAAIMAKEALLRPLDEPNPDADLAAKEAEVLEALKASGLGPQALGGRTFCLGVSILKEPCHIASLPMAVNVQCHAARHKEAVI